MKTRGIMRRGKVHEVKDTPLPTSLSPVSYPKEPLPLDDFEDHKRSMSLQEQRVSIAANLVGKGFAITTKTSSPTIEVRFEGNRKRVDGDLALEVFKTVLPYGWKVDLIANMGRMHEYVMMEVNPR